jgi:drug/metabolite transporter (DMT)-like permease
VTAVVGGLIAALCWGLATVSSSRSSPVIGGMSTVAWVSIFGLVAALPALALDRPSGPVAIETLGWLAVTGIGYILGLLLLYVAMARGPVGIAAPIASTEGAVAAIIAVWAGEHASLPLTVALAVVVAGLLLTTVSRGLPTQGRVDAPFLVVAAGAALLLGLGLYAAGQVGSGAPISWLLTVGRVVGVLLIAVPLALTRRLRFERSLLGWLVAAGVLEVLGYVGFGLGARDSIAVAAVLASQFAVVATLGAAALGERLERRRWIGVGVVAMGVAVVAAVQV